MNSGLSYLITTVRKANILQNASQQDNITEITGLQNSENNNYVAVGPKMQQTKIAVTKILLSLLITRHII